jgi:ABC-2 type transport system ATP-binding protein
MMASDGVLLRVTGLSKVFETKKARVAALSAVSFSMCRGEMVGYLGSNGAGKTTTVRAILGLLKPTAGTVEIQAQRVGFVLDVPSLYPQLTLKDNLRFYSALLGVPFERAKDCLALVGMSGHVDARVGTFSLGMKKRAELARALLNQPELLLLDEPFSDLDPSAQADLREILREQRSTGVSMLLTSHDLYNVQLLSTRFFFLKQGRLVRDLPASSASSSRELEILYHATLGEQDVQSNVS